MMAVRSSLEVEVDDPLGYAERRPHPRCTVSASLLSSPLACHTANYANWAVVAPVEFQLVDVGVKAFVVGAKRLQDLPHMAVGVVAVEGARAGSSSPDGTTTGRTM